MSNSIAKVIYLDQVLKDYFLLCSKGAIREGPQ